MNLSYSIPILLLAGFLSFVSGHWDNGTCEKTTTAIPYPIPYPMCYILSNILSDILSDVLSDILSDTLSNMMDGWPAENIQFVSRNPVALTSSSLFATWVAILECLSKLGLSSSLPADEHCNAQNFINRKK